VLRLKTAASDYWFVVGIPATALTLWLINLAPPFRSSFDTSSSALIALMETVAGVLGSIIGLGVAVVLVALQVLRTTYSSTVVRQVLQGPEFGRLLWLQLVTIGVAFACLGSVTDPPEPRTIALAHLSLASFALCLISLPGAIARMIDLTRIEGKRIQALVARVDLAALRVFDTMRRFSAHTDAEALDEHPLFILSEIGVRAVRERDRVLPPRVVTTTVRRLTTLISAGDEPTHEWDDQEWRARINAFMTVLNPIAHTAAEVGDQRTVATVISGLEAIHESVASRRMSWVTVHELNESLESIAVHCVRAGLRDAAKAAIYMVGRVQIEHLKLNVPPESELWEFNDYRLAEKEGGAEKSNQWHNVSSDYLPIIARIVEAATEVKAVDVVQTGIWQLARMTDPVRRLENLGPQQKAQMISLSLWHASSRMVAAAEKLGERSTLSLSAFHPLHIVDDLIAGEPWAQDQLKSFCSATLQLADRGLLEPFALNELGTVGRGAVNALAKVGNKALAAEATVLMAQTLAEVARIANHGQALGFGRILHEAEAQIDSLLKWHKGGLEMTSPEASRAVGAALADVRALLAQAGQPKERVIWPTLRDSHRTGAEPTISKELREAD
jgi:hypothetical protein